VRGLRQRWSGTKRSKKLPLCATLFGKVNLASRLAIQTTLHGTVIESDNPSG
jgi:hypothetical protein